MSKPKPPVLSTAGAVPTKNEKGQITMEKVKVARYVSGKRPEYAPDTSDEEEEDEIELKLGMKVPSTTTLPSMNTEGEVEDRRLKRLQERRQVEQEEEDRLQRHRRLHEPEVIGRSSDEDEDDRAPGKQDDAELSSEEEELDEDEIERRRMLLRERAKQRREEEEKELLDVEDEDKEGSEEDSSEWEEYSDSEEEDEVEPRLKPVFVRKKDRATIHEKEREEEKQRQLEAEAKKLAEEQRRQTLKMVMEELRKDHEEDKDDQGDEDAVNTDDDNDEEEYEAWKVRELKRIKHDREEREQLEREKLEAEKFHNMTEEERREEWKRNPKKIVNKAMKGKYKFLQKYYHRGVFFLDKEDEVFMRDFAAPTLDDHFNKTILPKVMQVKNFGRSGRTKYTHLVDQDTTQFESPWISDTAMNLKFHTTKGGGMKQTFEKPSVKKRK